MLRWSGQNANQKVGPDKMPTTEKKSRTKCQPRLAFCPVGILSGWHFVLPPFQSLPWRESLTFNNQRNIHQDTYCVLNSEILAEPNGESVENFSIGHKTNPQTKSAQTTEAGDEVQPSHLWQSLKFWEILFITGFQQVEIGALLTINGGFPEEDVHNGDVLFVGVVVLLTL